MYCASQILDSENPNITKTYPSVIDAIDECTKNERCGMFFDNKGEMNEYILCNDGGEMEISSFGSVLYIKSKF